MILEDVLFMSAVLLVFGVFFGGVFYDNVSEQPTVEVENTVEQDGEQYVTLNISHPNPEYIEVYQRDDGTLHSPAVENHPSYLVNPNKTIIVKNTVTNDEDEYRVLRDDVDGHLFVWRCFGEKPVCDDESDSENTISVQISENSSQTESEVNEQSVQTTKPSFEYCKAYRDWAEAEQAETFTCELSIDNPESVESVWILRNTNTEYGHTVFDKDAKDNNSWESVSPENLSETMVDGTETVVVHTDDHYYVYDLERNLSVNQTYQTDGPRVIDLVQKDRQYERFNGTNPYTEQ